MELPFHLKTLEPLPGALDILRFFTTVDGPIAGADDIMDSLDLSERSFSRAIRRLVTKGYMQMDGYMVYRLTEQGQRAVEELTAYDTGIEQTVVEADADDDELEPMSFSQTITRRMVIGVPHPLGAEHPAEAVIGFHNAGYESDPVNVVVRVSVVNGQPDRPADLLFTLAGEPSAQTLEIVPARLNPLRLRLEAYQIGDNPGDIEAAGGMFVDIPVRDGTPGALSAYGVDITLTV